MKAPIIKLLLFAPMVMKFGTDVKLDVLYTIIAKNIVTSLLLRHYGIITCILAHM